MKKNLIIAVSLMLLLIGCGTQNTQKENNNDYINELQSNYSEYIKLGEYKHVVDVESANITDEYIDGMLQSYLEVYAETDSEKKNGSIDVGQNINISYSITIDNDTENYDNQKIYIGHEEVAPGVDEWLTGKETGYIGEIDITYPKDYADENKAGKKATIKATINYIIGEPIYSEVNDEFIKELTKGEFDNLEKCREEMKTSLSETIKYNGGYQALNEITERAEIKKDISNFIDSEFEATKNDYQRYYDYIKETDSETQTSIWQAYGYNTENEYNSYLKEISNESVKQKLVVYNLANELGISISDDDVKKYKEDMLQYYSQEEIDSLYTEDSIKYMTWQYAVIMKLSDFQDIVKTE